MKRIWRGRTAEAGTYGPENGRGKTAFTNIDIMTPLQGKEIRCTMKIWQGGDGKRYPEKAG